MDFTAMSVNEILGQIRAGLSPEDRGAARAELARRRAVKPLSRRHHQGDTAANRPTEPGAP